ncbi:MAG: HD domain-containing protein [Deltaproteobacteria bacterium]|nr:HD domain-containing protein [Deltaproteobacteria bacterium]
MDVTEPAQTDRRIELEQLPGGKLAVAEAEGRAIQSLVADMVRIPFHLVTPGLNVPGDLFLPYQPPGGKLTLARVVKKGGSLSPATLLQLEKNGIDAFYGWPRDQQALLAAVTEQVTAELARRDLSPEAKGRILYDHAHVLVQSTMQSPKMGEKMGENIKLGLEYCRAFSSMIRENPQSLPNLMDFLVADYDLYTHSVNVCLLATSFGRFLGLTGKDLESLGLGALYHDLGKRNTPPEVLYKPGKLTPAEWKIVHRHPEEGYLLLADQPLLPREVPLMVRQHHENLDGSGYPQGLAEAELLTGSQILRIIDTYDAITSVRCYQKATEPFYAIHIMRDEMSGQISFLLLKEFIAFLGWIMRQ